MGRFVVRNEYDAEKLVQEASKLVEVVEAHLDWWKVVVGRLQDIEQSLRDAGYVGHAREVEKLLTRVYKLGWFKNVV